MLKGEIRGSIESRPSTRPKTVTFAPDPTYDESKEPLRPGSKSSTSSDSFLGNVARICCAGVGIGYLQKFFGMKIKRSIKSDVASRF